MRQITAFYLLYEALKNAQDDRELRGDVIEGEIGWIVFERMVMWGEVNRLRLQLNKAPIALRHVLVKESLASGHIDYTKKYAIGCAELVMTEAE